MLLTDPEVREFITHGYLLLESVIPADINKEVRNSILEEFETSGNPGNNLSPFVPELSRVLQNTRVTGALTSILGPEYGVHPHRHCHIAAQKTQSWHRDSFWDNFKRVSREPRWVILFYYPQDVTETSGPTEIVPGSHTSSGPFTRSKTLTVPAGSVVIMDYAMVHRGTKYVTNEFRMACKYEFFRTREPVKPSWDCADSFRYSDCAVWDWMCGLSASVDFPRLLHRLKNAFDTSEIFEDITAAATSLSPEETRAFLSTIELLYTEPCHRRDPALVECIGVLNEVLGEETIVCNSTLRDVASNGCAWSQQWVLMIWYRLRHLEEVPMALIQELGKTTSDRYVLAFALAIMTDTPTTMFLDRMCPFTPHDGLY